MTKRILNIIEILTIGFVIFGIVGSYENSNSLSRFSNQSNYLQIGIDVIIVPSLLFRAVKILLNIKRPYREMGKPKLIEFVIFGCCLIAILPDLANWYSWNYFASLYLYILIIFSLPLIFWLIEMIERTSNKKEKMKNYGYALMSITIPIIGYTIYLSQVN